ncbi:MAG: class I mannose-6-phosphate isomerase [Candidatus Borkfalkia sp.]
MMEDTKLCTRPLFFERNRVSRVYRGGLLFHDFFGDEPKDSRKPEEWVGSLVRAMDKEDGEGLSVVRGENVSFAELAARRPELLFGENNRFDVLVKVLDSAIRLPVQTHPDRAFSEKYLHSAFGKTEMWLILKTRPDACIYLGFGREISKEKFSELAEETKTAPDAMLPYLNRVEVREGDVYLIPARTVHAIGAGCLILEVQEPTDFTISPNIGAATIF